MKLSHFNFELPEELIGRVHPADIQRRGQD